MAAHGHDYDHTHGAPASPEGSGLAAYGAIKYLALVVIVLAIIGFLVWLVGQFS